jgi:hypothetical protein
LLRGLSRLGEPGGAEGEDFSHNLQVDKERKKKEQKKHYRKFLAFMSRLATSLFGGFALIALMLIMDLHPTKLTVEGIRVCQEAGRSTGRTWQKQEGQYSETRWVESFLDV